MHAWLRPLFILSAVFGACIDRASMAEMVTLTSDLDNMIYANDATRSNGAGGVLAAGTTTNTSPRRGLIHFDIASAIPAGAIIQTAELRLTVASFAGGSGGGTDPNAYTTTLYDVSRGWGEGIAGLGTTATGSGQGYVTATNNTSATWTHAFYNGTSWSTPGGDFAATARSSTGVAGMVDATFTWNSNALMIESVQQWLDSPSTNFGWILVGDESRAQTFRSFYSREATNAALRPALMITFQSVPEPTSLVLSLAIGLGACSRYRKKPN